MEKNKLKIDLMNVKQIEITTMEGDVIIINNDTIMELRTNPLFIMIVKMLENFCRKG